MGAGKGGGSGYWMDRAGVRVRTRGHTCEAVSYTKKCLAHAPDADMVGVQRFCLIWFQQRKGDTDFRVGELESNADLRRPRMHEPRNHLFKSSNGIAPILQTDISLNVKAGKVAVTCKSANLHPRQCPCLYNRF